MQTDHLPLEINFVCRIFRLGFSHKHIKLAQRYAQFSMQQDRITLLHQVNGHTNEYSRN